MKKVLTVALTEFLMFVRSRAFVTSIFLIPLLYGLLFLLGRSQVSHMTKGFESAPFAVIDHTGRLYSILRQKAAEQNASSEESNEGEGSLHGLKPVDAPLPGPEGSIDQLRLELSERVRRKNLVAFIEIPPQVFDPKSEEASPVCFYSERPTPAEYAAHYELMYWIDQTLNEAIQEHRFLEAKLDPNLIKTLSQEVDTVRRDLYETIPPATPRPGEAEKNEGATGSTSDDAAILAGSTCEIQNYAVSAVCVLLLFLATVTGVPLLLFNVLEEKMSRISEVLLGSISPFQFMMGKLFGCTAFSFLLASLYLGGLYGVAVLLDYLPVLPGFLFLCFALFLFLNVLLYGSLSIAAAAACSDIKDTQTALTPVMIFLMSPILLMSFIMTAPDSPLAVIASLFPLVAPCVMMARLPLDPAPPMWQILLSVLLTAATTLLFVWAAAKIFRTGVLMHGKRPTPRELLRWIMTT